MNGWIFFWSALLLVTLVLYAGLVVNVAFGGLKDIRKMFKALSDEDGGGESDED